MDIPSIIADLAHSGALDRAAAQSGARSFQIGDVVIGVLQHAHSGRPLDRVFAASIARAGISPSRAAAVETAITPLIESHLGTAFAPPASQLSRYTGWRSIALRLVRRAPQAIYSDKTG